LFNLRRGILPVFSKDGMSFDAMAEHLSQFGYTPADGYTANGLLNQVDRAVRGEWVGTPEGYARKAARDAKQAEIDRALQADDEQALSGLTEIDGAESVPSHALGDMLADALRAGVSPAAIHAKLGTEDVDVAEARAVLRQLIEDHKNESQHARSNARRQAPTAEGSRVAIDDGIPFGEDGYIAKTDEEIDRLFGLASDEPILSSYTEGDILQKEAREKDEAAAAAAEQKRKADLAGDSFQLNTPVGTAGAQLKPATTASQRGMFDAPTRGEVAQPAAAGKSTKSSNTLSDQLATMSDDDLSSMFDDVANETAAPETEKPKAKRAKAATTKNGTKKPRRIASKAELADTSKPAEVERAVKDIAKSIGVNLSSAGMEALEGLTKLFGGPGKLNSGLTFDEETYAKAKPHFQAMLRDFEAAGRDLRDLIKALIGQFGTGAKPYLLRFAQDLRNERTDTAAQRDRGDRPDGVGRAGDDLFNDGAGTGRRGAGEVGTRSSGKRPDDAGSVSADRTADAGASSSQRVASRQSGVARGAARDSDSGRGSDDSASRMDAGQRTDGAIDRATAAAAVVDEKPVAKVKASNKPGTPSEIKAQMPFLTIAEISDVRLSLDDNIDTAVAEYVPVSEVDARETIERITASWRRPGIIELVDRFADLPPAIKRAAAAHRASPNQVKGAIHNGRLYVVRENHRTAASLERTVFHEGYGHYGIRQLFGKEIHQRLNQLFLQIGGVRGFNEMAARHGVDLRLYRGMDKVPEEMRRAAMMEELLSHMAEDQRPSIARRAKEILGMIRAWLREHGFLRLAKLGDTDIAYLLKQARERVIQADGGSSIVVAPAAMKLSDETRAAYEQRIGELFAGAEPNRSGVKVLDRSDVLDLLGYGDMPVVINEKHAIDDGRYNHPLTREQWLQVPDWLENPVAVFKRDDGHLTVIAPDLVGGSPVVIGLQPRAMPAGGRSTEVRHLILTAYVKDRGPLPVANMIRDGGLLFVDTRKSPGFNRGSGLQLPSSGDHLRGLGYKVHTGADLFKYRSADDADIRFSIRDDDPDPATREALAKLGLAPKERRTLANIISKYINRDWRTLLNQLAARGYEGWLDGLTGIKRAEEALGVGIGAGDYQRSGYVGARLATGIADLMHGILFYGAPQWRDGVIGHKAGTKGLLEILGDLKGTELISDRLREGEIRAP
jgi:hypothetical protein